MTLIYTLPQLEECVARQFQELLGGKIVSWQLLYDFHESLVNHHDALWLVNADAIWLVDDCQIFSYHQPAQFSYITKLKFLIENAALLTIEWELLKNHDILTILKEFGWIIDPGSSLLSCDYIYLAEFAMQLHFRIYNSCSFFFLFSFFFFFFAGGKWYFKVIIIFPVFPHSTTSTILSCFGLDL